MHTLLDHAIALSGAALALGGIGLLFVASYVLMIPEGPIDWVLAGGGGIVFLVVGLLILHRQESAFSDWLLDTVEEILMAI